MRSGRVDTVLDCLRDRLLGKLGVTEAHRVGVDLKRRRNQRARVGAAARARIGAGGVEHLHELMQQHRVEMTVGLVEHHLDRLLDRECLAIDAVRGKRIEDVCDCHDASLDRDVLGGEPAWVATSIPALVVRQRDCRAHIEDRGGRTTQQTVPLLGVRLHDRALLGSELARLQEDCVGDRDLAHIVQRRGVADPPAEVRVHSDRFGEQRREASDALDVSAGVLVAKLDGHRQAPDSLGLGDLEL